VARDHIIVDAPRIDDLARVRQTKESVLVEAFGSLIPSRRQRPVVFPPVSVYYRIPMIGSSLNRFRRSPGPSPRASSAPILVRSVAEFSGNRSDLGGQGSAPNRCPTGMKGRHSVLLLVRPRLDLLRT
jgi:hypothetical protein